jgi:hypothetical protein
MEGDKPFAGTKDDFKIHFMLYIPTTEFNIQKKGLEPKRMKEALDFLNKTFGGSTEINAVGSYTGNNGKLIREKVFLIECYTHGKEWNANKEKVKAWLLKKKKEWKQESMALMFEEDMYWV